MLQPVLAALLAASARLGVVVAIATWLVVLLMHEVAAAVLYAMLGILALFFAT